MFIWICTPVKCTNIFLLYSMCTSTLYTKHTYCIIYYEVRVYIIKYVHIYMYVYNTHIRIYICVYTLILCIYLNVNMCIIHVHVNVYILYIVYILNVYILIHFFIYIFVYTLILCIYYNVCTHSQKVNCRNAIGSVPPFLRFRFCVESRCA